MRTEAGENYLPDSFSLSDSLSSWEQAVCVCFSSLYEKCGSDCFAVVGEMTEVAEDFYIRCIQNSTYGALEINTPKERFIWKELITGKQNGWSELAAYRLSLLLKVPYVPSIVIIQVGDRCGSVSQFVSNAYSPNDVQFDSQKRKNIKALLLSQEFIHQVALMFVFDFLIGNQDRHAGNWLVDMKLRKIWWIDHGSVRWICSKKSVFEAFKKVGYTLKILGISQKHIGNIMSGIRAELERLSDERLLFWQAISYEAWEKVFEGMPEQVGHFKRNESCESSWLAFQTLLNEKGIAFPEAELRKVLNKVKHWKPRDQSI